MGKILFLRTVFALFVGAMVLGGFFNQENDFIPKKVSSFLSKASLVRDFSFSSYEGNYGSGNVSDQNVKSQSFATCWVMISVASPDTQRLKINLASASNGARFMRMRREDVQGNEDLGVSDVRVFQNFGSLLSTPSSFSDLHDIVLPNVANGQMMGTLKTTTISDGFFEYSFAEKSLYSMQIDCQDARLLGNTRILWQEQ